MRTRAVLGFAPLAELACGISQALREPRRVHHPADAGGHLNDEKGLCASGDELANAGGW